MLVLAVCLVVLSGLYPELLLADWVPKTQPMGTIGVLQSSVM